MLSSVLAKDRELRNRMLGKPYYVHWREREIVMVWVLL